MSFAKMIAVLCLMFALYRKNIFVVDVIFTWLSVCTAYH